MWIDGGVKYTLATDQGPEAADLGPVAWGRFGTIETGKLADLLVLDADPLQDIANLRKINQVIKDGRIVDREALPTVRVLDFDPEAPWPY